MRTSRTSSALRPAAGAVVALVVLLACLAAAPLAGGQGAAAAARSLTVSPSTYVGGQQLTWTGNVGARGVRSLVLQFHMARPGDSWTTLSGFRSRTRADGTFRFSHPAPSMFGIRYRVKAGRHVSAVREFNARTQDLTLWVTGQGQNTVHAPGMVAEGREFGLTVDTTPDSIFRSPASDGLPVFRGRVLTLQRRLDGDTWSTVATTTVGSDGLGHFDGLVESAGVSAYRVRQASVTTGGNRIGWTHSFPLHVYAGQVAQNVLAALLASAPTSIAVDLAGNGTGTGGRATPNAGQTYRWSPSRWDFDWEQGQSLTSPPSRGSTGRGWWLDYSDGSGRAVKHNGGLMLDSKRYNGAGVGDFGTTRATLQGNAAAQGRWEVRMRARSAYETGARDYAMVAELVPARPSDHDCGAHDVTIARVSPLSNRLHYGVRSATARWDGAVTMSTAPIRGEHTFAVEYSRRRTTWFLDAKPIGTVAGPAAFSGVPMTLRLSLVGAGQQEMNQASLISDWQRGFPLTTGRSVASSKPLPRTAAGPAC